MLTKEVFYCVLALTLIWLNVLDSTNGREKIWPDIFGKWFNKYFSNYNKTVQFINKLIESLSYHYNSPIVTDWKIFHYNKIQQVTCVDDSQQMCVICHFWKATKLLVVKTQPRIPHSGVKQKGVKFCHSVSNSKYIVSSNFGQCFEIF